MCVVPAAAAGTLCAVTGATPACRGGGAALLPEYKSAPARKSQGL